MKATLNISKIVLFHFRCPLCGNELPEKTLIEFVNNWETNDLHRLQSMISQIYVATWEIRSGTSRWLTKKFQKSADQLIQLIFDGDKTIAPSTFLIKVSSEKLYNHTVCPVCRSGPGPRKADTYFTTWNDACRVQTANLYYESAGILTGLLNKHANAFSNDLMKYFQGIIIGILKTGSSVGLPSCPSCGRFTSALFGATKENPEVGRCRWCLDFETHT